MCAAQRHHAEVPLVFLVRRPSSLRRCMLFWAHFLALFAVGLADLSWSIRLLAAGMAFASAWMAWRYSPLVCAIQGGRDGRWQLQLSDGVWIDGAMDYASSRAWLGWVYLSFRLENGRHQGVTLFADSVDKEALRRLRGRLKLEAAGSSVR